ncbi:MAG: molecular chaperone DnaJ [Anaeroplasmataceae bacterium]
MAKNDFYDTLGVSKTASADEIKKAYRSLAKKYHPDVNKDANAEAKFKEINEAYETLSNPESKQRYDTYGSADPNQGFGGFGGFGGGGAQGFGGFEDIINQFFGGGRQSQQSQSRTNRAYKGEDIHVSMKISFKDAIFGCTKTIELTFTDNCPTCSGTGAFSKADIHVCEKCKGSGAVYVEQQTMFGRARTQVACPTCSGSGKTIKKKCEKCKGKGRLKVTKNLDIKIPAGIADGMSLRESGKGEAGINGGPHGDLYIEFKVESHPYFVRDKSDIILTVPVSYNQLTLGCILDVPTVDGIVSIKIPAGTQSLSKFLVKGKGAINPKTKVKGDQYVIVKLEIPTSISSEQKKKLEEFMSLDKGKNDPWTKFSNNFPKL